MITIYHHPHCSKSRAALALVEDFAAKNGVSFNIVEYLKTPLTFDELRSLQQTLGVEAQELVRHSEEDYATLQLAGADDATLLQAIVDHPTLLQRPIVSFHGRAIIARPPELASELLHAS